MDLSILRDNYVAIATGNFPSPAQLQKHKELLESKLLHYIHDTDVDEYLLLVFKLWCLTTYYITPTEHVPLRDVLDASSRCTQNGIAALVTCTHEQPADVSVEPGLVPVHTVHIVGYVLGEEGIRLCMGWVYANILKPMMLDIYIGFDVDVQDSTVRMKRMLCSFHSCRASELYDACFFMRLQRTMRFHHVLAYNTNEGVFRALSAYHHDNTNAVYSDTQRLGNYKILLGPTSTLDWLIVAAQTCKLLMTTYETEHFIVDVKPHAASVPHLFIDLDNQPSVYSNDGCVADHTHYDHMLCYIITTAFPKSLFARVLVNPGSVPADDPIFMLLR